MEQSKFEALTKVLATEGPRRGLLGAIAGGSLGMLLGFGPDEAGAQTRPRRNPNRCKGVNRICEPFESGKCCSKRCCPALGARARRVSVCAPKSASQCCPASLGGGYCDRDGYRKCCKPTAKSPDGFCCPQAGSDCCSANSVQAKDYCCPPGSHCCAEFSGCCADQPAAAGFNANSAPAPAPAGRKAG